MTGLHGPRRYSLAVVVVALFGAAVFELTIALGWFAKEVTAAGPVKMALYGFQSLIVFAAVVPLVMTFRTARQPLPMIVALGCASWLLGDVFYLSYAVLLDRALAYPSVADLAFQGFHVAIIAGLWSQILRRGEWPFWPTIGLGGLLCMLPAIIRISHPFPLDDLAYATFFMVLVATTMLIAAGAALHMKSYDLAIGLLLVVFADATFSAASLVGAGFQYALDPVYFVGFAVTSFAVVRVVDPGAAE